MNKVLLRFYYVRSICCALLLLSGMSAYSQSLAKVKELKCEHLADPIGIDADRPRLSWQMEDSTMGAAQTAYRVIVDKDSLAVSKLSGTVWDTKKMNASNCLVQYGGAPLEPFTKYFWAVQLWDAKGKALPQSPVSSFETGMMKMTSWTGNWISDRTDINTLPAAYFRKAFTASKKIRSARAYIAVGGLYELYINGAKVGNHRLDPMYTRFDRRTMYVSYDVTSQLQN